MSDEKKAAPVYDRLAGIVIASDEVAARMNREFSTRVTRQDVLLAWLIRDIEESLSPEKRG